MRGAQQRSRAGEMLEGPAKLAGLREHGDRCGTAARIAQELRVAIEVPRGK